MVGLMLLGLVSLRLCCNGSLGLCQGPGAGSIPARRFNEPSVIGYLHF